MQKSRTREATYNKELAEFVLMAKPPGPEDFWENMAGGMTRVANTGVWSRK